MLMSENCSRSSGNRCVSQVFPCVFFDYFQYSFYEEHLRVFLVFLESHAIVGQNKTQFPRKLSKCIFSLFCIWTVVLQAVYGRLKSYTFTAVWFITGQKQPSGGVLWKKCYWKFRNIHRKTPVPESFLIKLQALPATLLKKRLWYRCFPVNLAKF